MKIIINNDKSCALAVDAEDCWWTRDWWYCCSREADVRMSGKRKTYAPAFQGQAGRLVVETGWPVPMWPPRSVWVSKRWAAGCAPPARCPTPTIMGWRLMLTSVLSGCC